MAEKKTSTVLYSPTGEKYETSSRAEVTRLHEQFAALADDLDARAEECVAVGEGPAWDAAHGAATRIRRILAGTQ